MEIDGVGMSGVADATSRIVSLKHQGSNGQVTSQFYLVDVAGRGVKCKVTNSEGGLESTINISVMAFLYPLTSTYDRLDQFHTKAHFFGVGSPAMKDYELDVGTGQPVLNYYDSVCLPVNGSGVYSVEWVQ